METSEGPAEKTPALVRRTVLGDMCAHTTWDFCKVCRNEDGSANNDGNCNPPKYWDFGNDTSKPVHTGCTPEEMNSCLGKPAHGVGINEATPDGTTTCGPPQGENYSVGFYSYAWVPDGATQACVPICRNTAHGQQYYKVICNALYMWAYLQGLINGNASCHKPAQNCHYNDHTREAFYEDFGLGHNCNPSFDTGVFATCAADPTDLDNCKVTVQGTDWDVLHTCWDDAWQMLCTGSWHQQEGNCFMLADQQNASNTCIATCNSYGIPVTGCDDVFTANNCPGTGTPAPAPSGGKGGFFVGGERPWRQTG